MEEHLTAELIERQPPRKTVAVCVDNHTWEITMNITQVYKEEDHKQLRKVFEANVPNCPACGKEWSHTDSSLLP